MTTLTSDVKIDGFPLSNMSSSSSLVVTLPAKTIHGRQRLMMNSIRFDLSLIYLPLLYNCLHLCRSLYLDFFTLILKMQNNPSYVLKGTMQLIIQTEHVLVRAASCVKSVYSYKTICRSPLGNTEHLPVYLHYSGEYYCTNVSLF